MYLIEIVIILLYNQSIILYQLMFKKRSYFMDNYNRPSKYSFLLPIGIIMLLPIFVVSFIQSGNIIDKTFFFIALLGYVLIIISTLLGYRKNVKN